MTGARFEAVLAELYADDDARRRFLADPRGHARRAGLADGEVEAIAAIDRLGLELAARSFALKRGKRGPRRRRWWPRLARRAVRDFLTGADAWRYLFLRRQRPAR